MKMTISLNLFDTLDQQIYVNLPYFFMGNLICFKQMINL